MSREIGEIKFRGKRVDNGEWIYGHYLKSASTLIAIDGGLVDGHFKLREVDPATVGQYTGLKDKNGKEIFEGDIVDVEMERVSHLGKIEKHPFIERHVVEWAQKDTGFRFKGCDDGVYWIIEDTDMTVIGNIYENPELLKGVEQ